MLEAGSLPVFDTVDGRLAPAPVPDMSITSGFVLRELVVKEYDPSLHDTHTALAASLLQATGQVDMVHIEPEYREASFGPYLEGHMDGLTGRYYESHTTHPSDQGDHSELQLSLYDLTPAEHAELVYLLSCGYGAESLALVYLGPLRHGVSVGTLSAGLKGRKPDSQWTNVAGPNSTLVFPNGYDATIVGAPADLYVHRFRTVPDGDHDGDRTLSLSRIEPIN